LACPAVMPTRLGTAAFATVVGGGVAVVGAGGTEVLGGADAVGWAVALVAADLVAALLESGSKPARSSSAPTLPATIQNPLRRHSGLGFGGRPRGGGGPHPAGWVGGWSCGGGWGCCPQPCGFTHRSGKAGPPSSRNHGHIGKAPGTPGSLRPRATGLLWNSRVGRSLGGTHPMQNRVRHGHPDGHPDDPSGSVGSRLDRRATQREQAGSVSG
jgi:hypothetical protein